jgi:hypothetical protein
MVDHKDEVQCAIFVSEVEGCCNDVLSKSEEHFELVSRLDVFQIFAPPGDIILLVGSVAF